MAQALSPEQAHARMKPAEGLAVHLVAAEPLIRQPVTITFDDRGRLWVIQYLQYPNPAGLKPVEVDRYLRTRYDRHPEPPPRGPRGLDRVTILSDPDEKGRYRQAKDFVSGLNLASGLALGQGGVYVLQAPYLLFYADRNHDDVPDGNPEVLLDGFGLEDAHAVGNSLMWGPDGWLYGAQGSTVTARIKDPLTKKLFEFQQGVWRYHPRTRQFELFAEGGGNTWGLDFTPDGEVIAGTNFGGVAALHMVQGGYYVKGFAKHGPLHNPYTFGYFEHLPCQQFRGGHVTCGGIVYAGGLLPEKFNQRYLACNLLDNNLYCYELQPRASSYTMRHESVLLESQDRWFRPIDLLTGPEGAVYVVDWYDKRANHVDPVDNWDKTNGRIYKLLPAGQSPGTVLKSSRSSPVPELIERLHSKNSWQRTEARGQLSESSDPAVRQALLAYHQQPGMISIDSLGALYGQGGLTVELAGPLLHDARPEIRQWIVRCVTDHATPEGIKCWEPLLPNLVTLARTETAPRVLSQIASSARRLIDATQKTELTYAVVRELIRRTEVENDPHLPLLMWWAVEAAITHDRERLSLSSLQLEQDSAWNQKYVQGFLLPRLAQRFAGTNSEAAVQSLTSLLTQAEAFGDARCLNTLLSGIETAWKGKRIDNVAPALLEVLGRHRNAKGLAQQVLRLLIRCGDARAREAGLIQLSKQSGNEADRKRLLLALSSSGVVLPADQVKALWSSAPTDGFRLSLLDYLDTRRDVTVLLRELLQGSQENRVIRSRLLAMHVARKETAIQLGQAIAQGEVAPKELALDQVQQLQRYNDPSLHAVVAKHWGTVTEQTTGEKRARIQSVIHMLGQRSGSATNGKAHFEKHCATCHQLFGTGGKAGPDLTSADRRNREYLVTQVIDPNLVVRPEYVTQMLVTTDGRTYRGLLVEQHPNSIVLLDAEANRLTFGRDSIETLQPTRTSLMPEKLLDSLDDDQIRDLFAYVQQPAPQTPGEPTALPFKADSIREPVKFDFADKMVNGMHRFLDQELAEAERRRSDQWQRDHGTVEKHRDTLAARRQRLKALLGMVEERPNPPELEYVSSPSRPARIGRGSGYDIFTVRWRAFSEVYAEGVLLVPDTAAVADVVIVPDADQSPELMAGLVMGKADLPVAARLALAGCRVLVPVLIDRQDTYSGIPGIRMTNQPHREWIYRQAFEMGRHLIGYEVQKVLAGVDWLQATQVKARPIGVLGYAEGGLIALHAGALDERIAVTGVDGYFSSRKGVWQEPIYRNVWKQLLAFGDSEIVSLYPPRALVLGQRPPPMIKGPPAVRSGRSGAAPGQTGALYFEEEWNRLAPVRQLFPKSFHHVDQLTQREEGLQAFLTPLTGQSLRKTADTVQSFHSPVEPALRMQRQVSQLAEHTQKLLRSSQAYREKHFWSKLDRSTFAKYDQSVAPFREQFEMEVIGKINKPLSEARPRARKIDEQPGYTTYEIELDVVAPEVIAYGWLLLPRDIKEGEKRPVVVCQHGLEGRPSDLADAKVKHPAYHQYACRLAERGFVVFAPQNPYLFGDRFRLLQRKANPVGLSLFSFIVAQHRQVTSWLASLPFVDGHRIGFYGLSYGGKTAMRVPALVPRYCLSICSADFNEWIWKNVSNNNGYTYLLTGEWEMVEWNLGHTFNYAEMAALIAPRPFMVERGHRDGVAPDEQVAYEYARVRRHYADLKIPERTMIEFFDGPHTIHGQGTFDFLHQHLGWPRKQTHPAR